MNKKFKVLRRYLVKDSEGLIEGQLSIEDAEELVREYEGTEKQDKVSIEPDDYLIIEDEHPNPDEAYDAWKDGSGYTKE